MSIKTLLEGELEKAQLQLAARDMVDQLQDMIQKLTKLKIEELAALKEGLRSNMGNDTASQFESAVSAALQTSIDAVSETKNQVDQAALAISGEGSMPGVGDTGGLEQAMNLGDEEDVGGEEDMAAPASDAAAGGEEPLGRSKRESRERLKAMIEHLERRVTEARKAKKAPMKMEAKKKPMFKGKAKK